VELQLSMLDFLDVKKRCHAIYEILRLRVGDAEEGKEEIEEGKEKAKREAMKTKMLPLPRACPVWVAAKLREELAAGDTGGRVVRPKAGEEVPVAG